MKKTNKIHEKIKGLKDDFSIAGKFDLTFKKETIEFEKNGFNKEITISLLPELESPEFENIATSLFKNEEATLFKHSEKCNTAKNIVVSGKDFTNSLGQSTIKIKEQICKPANWYIIDQFNFVATPVNSKPVILVFTFNSQEEKITVSTFNLDGNPFSSSFQWHLMLNYSDNGIIVE